MDAITTVLIAFVFVCIVMPRLVKNKPQFYWSVILVAAIIFLNTVAKMFPDNSVPSRVVLVFVGFAQFITFVVLILSTGGLSLHELSEELGNAYEVMRRGETEKTVIIPPPGGSGGDEPLPGDKR